MKFGAVGAAVLPALNLLAAAVPSAAHLATIADHVSSARAVMPGAIGKVVQLIEELQSRIEADGTKEQQTYNTYACWCEETTARKASHIQEGMASIEKLQASIKKNAAEVAAHQAEIANLKQDIKENIESQTAATEMREKEKSEFEASKTESESAIAALAAAITVLTGAGAGKPKGSFLGTLQEAQMLSVVDGVKKVLKSTVTSEKLSSQELEVMDQFVRKPEAFVGSQLSGFVSAAQIAHNPFGDYAPQSTRIQGILAQLKESFESELQTAISEEADKEKEFQALMATKSKEAATLSKTLEIQEESAASKSAALAEQKTMRDDTQADVEADEAFFTETKSACKAKAVDWAERTRLRTEELQGISLALSILARPDFLKATKTPTSFLQLHVESDGDPREKLYAHLRKMATQFRKMGLARVAAEVKTGGHFDRVIVMIDEMMKTLREEEAEDIAHRDACQMKTNANSNEISDLEHDILKTNQEMGATALSIGQLGKEIEALESEIDQSKADLKALLDDRNEADTDFKKTLADNQLAVSTLEEAILAMSQFYANNKLSLTLAQKKADPKVYTKDDDVAPETWSTPYGGRSSEGGGLVSILNMIKEDLEKDIAKQREEDAADQAAYLKSRASLEDGLDKQTALKVAKEKGRSDLQSKNQDLDEFKNGKDEQLKAEQGIETALGTNCKWVTTHFETRRTQRKLEMDGLVEAKSFLSGANIP